MLNVICLIAVAIAQGSPQDDGSRMFHAKLWTGTVTIECNQSANEQPTTLTIKRSFGFSVSLGSRQAVGGEKTPRAYWTDDGASTVEGNSSDKRVEAGLDGEVAAVDTETGQVGGKLQWGPIQLAINPQSKSYRLVVNPVYFNVRHIRKIYNNGVETIEIDDVLPGMSGSPIVEIEKPLPKSGTTLAGTAAVKEQYGSTLNQGMIDHLTYTVKWTLNPGGSPPDFVIDTASFKDYVPSDDSGKVTVRTAKPDAAPAFLRITVSGISNEPGTCMNSTKSGTEPDMEVLAEENPDFDVPVNRDGSITMLTKNEVRSATLSIRCRDYGPYATVRAEAKIKGEWKHVKVLGSEATSTSFPLDENGNKVADAWETKYGVFGKPAETDDEKSLGNKLDGDGYTLYEEYRGLMAKDKHMRLDPKRKDLCLVNMLQEKTRPGLALFEKLSGIRIVEILRTEFDPGRIVNFRKNSVTKGGDQYGLLLEYGDTLVGLARMVGVDGPTAMSRSPKKCMQINFMLNFDKWGAAAAATDIAHEIGHACGLKHHGDASNVSFDTSLIDSKGHLVIPASRADHQIFDEKGMLINIRPYVVENPKLVGYTHRSMVSGDLRCIMCNTGVFNHAYRFVGGIHQIAKVPDTQIIGDRFCTSTIGTLYNKPGSKPWPLFGDAVTDLGDERGNCLAKLRVKDW